MQSEKRLLDTCLLLHDERWKVSFVMRVQVALFYCDTVLLRCPSVGGAAWYKGPRRPFRVISYFGAVHFFVYSDECECLQAAHRG